MGQTRQRLTIGQETAELPSDFCGHIPVLMGQFLVSESFNCCAGTLLYVRMPAIAAPLSPEQSRELAWNERRVVTAGPPISPTLSAFTSVLLSSFTSIHQDPMPVLNTRLSNFNLHLGKFTESLWPLAPLAPVATFEFFRSCIETCQNDDHDHCSPHAPKYFYCSPGIYTEQPLVGRENCGTNCRDLSK